MARTCTLCRHPQRTDIDGALVAGTPFRQIAEHYGTSPASLFRHRQHVAGTLAKAKDASDALRGDDLLGKARALVADAQRIAMAAEKSNDLRTALQGVREQARVVELMAKLLGEVSDGVTVNVATILAPQVVAGMPLAEKELRVRNAAAAIERVKAKSLPLPEAVP